MVKGAYAQLPRYFADADRVMDLETRLVLRAWSTLQGFTPTPTRSSDPFGSGRPQGRHGSAGRVRHVRVARHEDERAARDHPKEQEAYALGEKIFYFRGGPHDFACATCHGEDDKRIRLQDLPNLTSTKRRAEGYTTWPAYRVSQGELRTFQWRLYDCFRQQRFPELEFASDASIALTMFLARQRQRRARSTRRRSSAERDDA